jgi:hypothetical protein
VTPRELVVALGLLAPLAAHAGPTRVRLAAVDASRCADEGLLRVFVSEVEREGRAVPAPAASYRLVMDGTLSADPPREAVTLAESDAPLRVALVVQGNDTFVPIADPLTRAGDRLLSALPARALVDVVHYSSTVDVVASRAAVGAALAAWAAIVPESRGTARLVDALGAALDGLAEPAGARRRVLVLVADGRDVALERPRIRELAARAARQGVTIMPIAYSPTQAMAPEDREPFLGLGELAKQTGGSFRWAETPEDLVPEALALSEELRTQWVLEIPSPDRCAAEHRVQVERAGARSNALVVPAVAGWSAAPIAAGLLSVVLLIGAAAWARLRKKRAG